MLLCFSSTVPGTESQSSYCLLPGRDLGMFSQSFAFGRSTHSETNSVCYLEVREEVYRVAESTHPQCRVLRSILPPLEVGQSQSVPHLCYYAALPDHE